ncbi:uncharacterized protein LOC110455218 [Mizuhopecten yessoensis]|uniref:Uncharacterized protein n=1 Tax=Mizuhopecten yessoensis TaxID=6573 RepID=A0A210QDF0_MIZYE|nr:uncharacterized protein LOC110455218 [Mizuhopecten yessoensis]OWF46777.1 hypothetical protein KP79_PYT18887 [Mizuhopecten yessoensis]
MPKFAILGSSYISRLRDFCEGDLKVPGECRFFGKGGMRTDTIPNWMMTDLRALDAWAVFIQLGGNDIRQNSNPREFSTGFLCSRKHWQRRVQQCTSLRFVDAEISAKHLDLLRNLSTSRGMPSTDSYGRNMEHASSGSPFSTQPITMIDLSTFQKLELGSTFFVVRRVFFRVNPDI